MFLVVGLASAPSGEVYYLDMRRDVQTLSPSVYVLDHAIRQSKKCRKPSALSIVPRITEDHSETLALKPKL